jgi:hypothetical protein
MRTSSLLSIVATLAFTGAAVAQHAGLQRCRAITDTGARLACYDALADTPAATQPTAPAAGAMQATAVAAAAPVAAQRTPDGFGLPQRATEPQELRSRVGAGFAGWGPNSRIRLENGQVWQVIDGSSVSLPERARAVTVRRGLLGAYHLEFEGLNTAPKVRRVE